MDEIEGEERVSSGFFMGYFSRFIWWMKLREKKGSNQEKRLIINKETIKRLKYLVFNSFNINF